MSRFFVLTVGGFEQYKYAFYEPPQDANYADAWPTCPECNGPVGGRYWLPPHQVTLKQPRNIGDFLFGGGGADLLVSERFLRAYETDGLTGIERTCSVQVTRMGTTKKASTYAFPVLFGVWFQHGPARVDYDAMSVIWEHLPQPDHCRVCGPGGGGKNGGWRSHQRVVIEQGTWAGADFFYPLNLSGTLVLSERARSFVERHGFTNCIVTPAEEYGYSFA